MKKRRNTSLGYVDLVAGILGIIILGIALSLEMFAYGRHDMQSEAVAKGHAIFVVDAEKNIDFKWLATQTMKVEKYR